MKPPVHLPVLIHDDVLDPFPKPCLHLANEKLEKVSPEFGTRPPCSRHRKSLAPRLRRRPITDGDKLRPPARFGLPSQFVEPRTQHICGAPAAVARCVMSEPVFQGPLRGMAWGSSARV